MRPGRGLAFLLLALVAAAMLPPTLPGGQRWVDIMAMWQPLEEEDPVAYRFWLPRQGSPLDVTVLKLLGGNHARHWRLVVQETTPDRIGSPRRMYPPGDQGYTGDALLSDGRIVAEHDVILRNDVRPSPVPKMYYRRVAGD